MLKKISGCLFIALSLVSTLYASNASTSTPITLIIKKFPLHVDGKTFMEYRVEQPDGTWGFRGVQGQYFDATVKNETDKPTVLHWHGLIVPNNQDGVPYVTQAPIPPGGVYHYRFKLLQAGTYWMHSHFDLQVQQFLSAPMIILDPKEKPADKDVTLFIADFTHKNPRILLQELHQHKMAMDMDMSKADMQSMNMSSTSAKPDLNDIDYDAFLTNYRTLKQPDVVRVRPQQTVRLRLIDGAAGTNFYVNIGKLTGTMIAMDGASIKPIHGNQFQIAIGQRLDILVTLPKGPGVYPILAQGEGTHKQTGLILATPGAAIPSFSERATRIAPALNYNQERSLHSPAPLPQQTPGQVLHFKLEGNMMNYVWTINKQAWPNITPTLVENNKRIEMVFTNQSGMAHPMHLHGHVFEVTKINDQAITAGAMHDTILVLPHTSVTVEFDANNPGNWMLHCHMLYHQESGMMTLIEYPGFKTPSLKELSHM